MNRILFAASSLIQGKETSQKSIAEQVIELTQSIREDRLKATQQRMENETK